MPTSRQPGHPEHSVIDLVQSGNQEPEVQIERTREVAGLAHVHLVVSGFFSFSLYPRSMQPVSTVPD